jgi:micrococcal nuclease
MRKACAALFLFCVSTLPVGAATQIVGKVVRIADGDTLTVLDSANRQHRVRLAAIDAPEKNQAFGNRSRQSLAEICFQKQAQVLATGRNRDRVVGTVICAGVDAGAAQVERGMAWVYPQYAPKRSPLYGLETEARNGRVGLWQDKAPLEPWEFRRANR